MKESGVETEWEVEVEFTFCELALPDLVVVDVTNPETATTGGQF